MMPRLRSYLHFGYRAGFATILVSCAPATYNSPMVLEEGTSSIGMAVGIPLTANDTVTAVVPADLAVLLRRGLTPRMDVGAKGFLFGFSGFGGASLLVDTKYAIDQNGPTLISVDLGGMIALIYNEGGPVETRILSLHPLILAGSERYYVGLGLDYTSSTTIHGHIDGPEWVSRDKELHPRLVLGVSRGHKWRITGEVNLLAFDAGPSDSAIMIGLSIQRILRTE